MTSKYTNPEAETKAAKTLAKMMHRFQVDKMGEPYVDHLCRVARKVVSIPGSGARAMCEAVAWLHDIVEDTDVTLDQLRDLGFSNSTVNAVAFLTREEGDDDVERETYAEYINELVTCGSLEALVVKVADLEDHLDTKQNLPKSLVKRYEKHIKAVRAELMARLGK